MREKSFKPDETYISLRNFGFAGLIPGYKNPREKTAWRGGGSEPFSCMDSLVVYTGTHRKNIVLVLE